jgi:hypothetical protein
MRRDAATAVARARRWVVSVRDDDDGWMRDGGCGGDVVGSKNESRLRETGKPAECLRQGFLATHDTSSSSSSSSHTHAQLWLPCISGQTPSRSQRVPKFACRHAACLLACFTMVESSRPCQATGYVSTKCHGCPREARALILHAINASGHTSRRLLLPR